MTRGSAAEKALLGVTCLKRNSAQQNLPAALAAVPWLLACSALRAKDAFVAQTGRLFGAPQAGASGTFGDANRLYRLK